MASARTRRPRRPSSSAFAIRFKALEATTRTVSRASAASALALFRRTFRVAIVTAFTSAGRASSQRSRSFGAERVLFCVATPGRARARPARPPRARQKPMRQRANAALSGTQRSSSGTGTPPTHWRSLSDRGSIHSSTASNSSGQSSAANSHELMHSAGGSSGQTSGRAHKPSQPVASLALLPPAPAAPLAPAVPAAPPLPAAPAAPPLPAAPRPAAPAAPLIPAPPLAPAASRPAAPPALLPALPAASSSLPSSSEQAGGKLMRSTGRSQAVRIQPA
jgi:hypothetical protein